jgi:hypothetical protein
MSDNPIPDISPELRLKASNGFWGGGTYAFAYGNFFFKPPRRRRRRFWVPLEFDDADAVTHSIWKFLVWGGRPLPGDPFAPIGDPQAFIDAAMEWFEHEDGPGMPQHGDVLVGKDAKGAPVEIHIVEDFANPGNFQQKPPP